MELCHTKTTKTARIWIWVDLAKLTYYNYKYLSMLSSLKRVGTRCIEHSGAVQVETSFVLEKTQSKYNIG